MSEEMFGEVPTDVPAHYLGGHAAYILSDGERNEDMGQQDYAFVLNEIAGLARVPTGEEDERATQKVVSVEEAGDDALAPDEYTSNIFGSEVEAWADYALDTVETPDAEDETEDDSEQRFQLP